MATIVGVGGGAASQIHCMQVFIVQLNRDSANSFGWWLGHICTKVPVYLVSMALTHLYHTPPNIVLSNLQSVKIPLVALLIYLY